MGFQSAFFVDFHAEVQVLSVCPFAMPTLPIFLRIGPEEQTKSKSTKHTFWGGSLLKRFCKMFPLACLGSMATAVQPNGKLNFE